MGKKDKQGRILAAGKGPKVKDAKRKGSKRKVELQATKVGVEKSGINTGIDAGTYQCC